MHRRWGDSRISRAQSPLLGQGLLRRSLGRSLLANFIAGSALLVAGGWVRASASHSVQNQLVYKNGLSAVSPLSKLKKLHKRRDASPLTRSASKPMGKILGGGKILPKMSTFKKQFSEILRSQRRSRRKTQKNQKCQGADLFR